MKIGSKLTISHITMALVPTIIMAVGMLFLVNDKLSEMGLQAREEGLDIVVAESESALINSVEDKLKVIHEKKQNEVESVMATMVSDVEYLATSPEINEFYDGLKFYHDFGGIIDDGTIDVKSDSYNSLYAEGGPFFDQFVSFKGYYDVFLICAKHGHVLYSQARESDCGANLSTGSLHDEGLGQLWQKVVQSKATCLQDFSKYSPSNNEYAAFIGTPYYNQENEFVAVVAVQMDPSKIENIVTGQLGLGETGDSFMVGMNSDGSTSLRSVWRSKGKQIGTPKSGEFVRNIMSGISGAGVKINPEGNQIVAAYSPLNVAGVQWGLVTTQNTSEALAVLNSMMQYSESAVDNMHKTEEAATNAVQAMGLILLLVFGLVSAGIAIIISRKITKPLVAAVKVADAVAEGDLNNRINSSAQDEVGFLSNALDSMCDGLQKKAQVAQQISEGDLTMMVEPASAKDGLGQALGEMTDKLNTILSGVNQAADKVGGGRQRDF